MGVAVSNSVKSPTSDNVGSVKDDSGMATNVVLAVGIGPQAHSDKELLQFPVSLAVILIFFQVGHSRKYGDHRRPTSVFVGQRHAVSSVSSQNRAWTKMWEQRLESRRNLQPFNSYFQFRFGGRHLESLFNNVGRH